MIITCLCYGYIILWMIVVLGEVFLPLEKEPKKLIFHIINGLIIIPIIGRALAWW